MPTRLTNRTERLVKMEQLLFRSMSGLRAVELAKACGVDRRTIYRDLSLLDEVGVPIYQENGRFRLEREQYLASIRLSFDETVALLLAASLSRQRNPHLTSAIEKLSHALPESVAAHAHVLVDLLQSDADDAKIEILDTITHAWAEQRCVKLWYGARNGGGVSTREVSVYFVEFKPNGSVYAVGFDTLSQRVRSFKLSRIQRAELLETSYLIPFHFDTKRYLFYLRATSRSRARRSDDHTA